MSRSFGSQVNFYLKRILIGILLTGIGVSLCEAYHIYKDTRTWEVPLDIIYQEHNIEIHGHVFLSDRVWRYFKGTPSIVFSGEKLMEYTDSNKSIDFKLISRNNIQEAALPSSSIKVSSNKLMVTEGKLSPVLLKPALKIVHYHKGLNEFRIILNDYPLPDAELSAKIVLDALEKRTNVYAPLLFTLICVIFLFILCNRNLFQLWK